MGIVEEASTRVTTHSCHLPLSPAITYLALAVEYMVLDKTFTFKALYVLGRISGIKKKQSVERRSFTQRFFSMRSIPDGRLRPLSVIL